MKLKDVAAGAPLKETFTNAFEYSDCWVDDARLVVLNAMDAKARGADIRTRTEAATARGENGKWTIDLEDKATGKRERVNASVLVNAAGPWVDDVLQRKTGVNGKPRIRLVKGSHIVVPKLFDHDRAYIFQNDDKRIVFAIPYETDYTLIGTTDVDYTGDPGAVKIDADEIAYLCKLASAYFKQPIAPQSVVWTYSGVRPLMDDGATAAQEATRDYVLELDDRLGAPLLNIFGGKITTYRRLAEAAIEKLDGLLDTGTAWTAGATLPGGDFPVDGVPALERDVQRLAPSLPGSTVHRLVRTYGTRAKQIVTGDGGHGMGQMLGADLSESEASYLVDNEWARTADDILWRRTKLGLRVTPEEFRPAVQLAGGAPPARGMNRVELMRV